MKTNIMQLNFTLSACIFVALHLIKKYLLLLIAVASLLVVEGNVSAEIVTLDSYPLVCQKGLVALDHDINYFNQAFGLPISKKSHKLTDPGFEDVVMTEITFQKGLTLIYLTGNGKDIVYEVTLESVEAQKQFGFDVRTKNDIKNLYGTPDKETPSLLIYQCEGQVLTFTIKKGKISNVKVHTESSSM